MWKGVLLKMLVVVWARCVCVCVYQAQFFLFFPHKKRMKRSWRFVRTGRVSDWNVCGNHKTMIAEDVPLAEFMYLVFTRLPGESYCRWLWFLCLHNAFWVLINSLVCWFMITGDPVTFLYVQRIDCCRDKDAELHSQMQQLQQLRTYITESEQQHRPQQVWIQECETLSNKLKVHMHSLSVCRSVTLCVSLFLSLSFSFFLSLSPIIALI